MHGHDTEVIEMTSKAWLRKLSNIDLKESLEFRFHMVMCRCRIDWHLLPTYTPFYVVV